jgi:hypothetical protein
MADIARTDEVWNSNARDADLPEFVEPQLATLVDEPPSGKALRRLPLRERKALLKKPIGQPTKNALLTVKEGAALEALGLESPPLLSGGKGIHVVVPIQREHEWPVVKQFSGALAERVAAEAPDKYLATMSKAKQTGRIFIDHFRNEFGATAVAPTRPTRVPAPPSPGR